MYELIKVSESCYYIDCPSKIGIVKISEDEVCLIDSGNEKGTGKKILRIVEEQGWKVAAILNTHSHADHIGGNAFLQEKTGCKIYAPDIERDFTEHPVLESAILYGGYPSADLRHKFLLAEPSAVEKLTPENIPADLEAIPLSGHWFSMVGFKSKDGIVYLADALSSEQTLLKYGIGVIYDVAAYLDTLEKIKGMEAALFVPSHAEPTADIKPLADINIAAVKKTAAHIIEICKTPSSFEDILKSLFDIYGLSLDFQQYALVGCTVRSYLAYLKDSGKVTVIFADNRMLWQSL